jgi:hypothetical protein
LTARNSTLENRRIHFDRLKLDNTKSAIRLGKKEEAKVVAKEVKQEAEAQADNAWTVKWTTLRSTTTISPLTTTTRRGSHMALITPI